MSDKAIKIIELKGSPKALGHQHGEYLRNAIKEIAEIRLERMCATSHFTKVKDVFELAQKHLAPLKNYDEGLFLELEGIAEASGLSLEKLVVLNHFTDMRDIDPRYTGQDLGGCSIIYSPSSNGPFLGQTWDIHASALPYVIMLKVDNSILFSIAGCLGMTGINQNGLGIAINNLSSTDAKIGVLWPAIIRKALRNDCAKNAKEEILACPNGSGRHYAIADSKDCFGIETSGSKKKLVFSDPKQIYFHTNHCIDAEMRKTHIIRQGSTTLGRYRHLDQNTRHQDLKTLEEVFLAFKDVSMPAEKNYPHKTATCGTIVMDLKKREVLACSGIAHEDVLKNINGYKFNA